MPRSSAARREDTWDTGEMPPLAHDGRGPVPVEPPLGSGGGGLTRVTVNLNRQAVTALESLSEATGYSKTDTINRALQVYAIVQEIMAKNGGILQVKHADGDLERIHIV